MKILHIAETVQGGVSTYLDLIVAHQVASEKLTGVALLVPDEQVSVLREIRALPAVGIFTFPGTSRIARCMGLMRRLYAVLRDFRPDVVHLHSTFAGLICRIMLVGSPAKVIYQPHGVSFDPARVGFVTRFLYVLIERALLFFTDKVLAISDYEKSLLDVHGFSSKTVLVMNAVRDTLCKPGERPARNHFLYVGRLDQQKGFDLLYDFWQHRQEKLVVIGESVVSEDMQYCSSAHIELKGWVDQRNIDAYFASALAVIVPSRWEGFGLVVPEAYRNGTPVICSDRGALPSLVVEGITGYIFSLSNFDQALSECIDLVRQGGGGMHGACRDYFLSNFDSKLMNARLEEVYFS